MRSLDKQFQFDASKIAEKAADSVLEAKVKDMPGLGPYLASFKLHLNELKANKTPLHPVFGLRYIKRAIENLNNMDLKAAMAAFE